MECKKLGKTTNYEIDHDSKTIKINLQIYLMKSKPLKAL